MSSLRIGIKRAELDQAKVWSVRFFALLGAPTYDADSRAGT